MQIESSRTIARDSSRAATQPVRTYPLSSVDLRSPLLMKSATTLHKKPGSVRYAAVRVAEALVARHCDGTGGPVEGGGEGLEQGLPSYGESALIGYGLPVRDGQVQIGVDRPGILEDP